MTPINLAVFSRTTSFQSENGKFSSFNSYVVEGTLGSLSSHSFQYFWFLLKYHLLWLKGMWNNVEEEHDIIIVELNNQQMGFSTG